MSWFWIVVSVDFSKENLRWRENGSAGLINSHGDASRAPLLLPHNLLIKHTHPISTPSLLSNIPITTSQHHTTLHRPLILLHLSHSPLPSPNHMTALHPAPHRIPPSQTLHHPNSQNQQCFTEADHPATLSGEKKRISILSPREEEDADFRWHIKRASLLERCEASAPASAPAGRIGWVG